MIKIQFPTLGKWGKYWFAMVAIYSIVVTGYILTETAKPLGSRDFHQFWYAGHFIIQGTDPYQAFFAHEPPRLPVYYLDGVIVNQYPVAQPKLEITPSNTPAMLVLLSPLAVLSWGHAKWIFMAINVLLLLGTGWLVLRRVPFGNIRLPALEELFLFLAYFDLSASRIAIENGQTTLLVFLLMLVVIIEVDRAWHISGISLGLALSKYSLSLPIFLFFLYKKKYKSLLFTVFVQMVGILVLSEVTKQSPVTIIYENIMLFFRLFDQPGIHLSRWLKFLSSNHFVTEVPVLLMAAVVFALVLVWSHRSNRVSAYVQSILHFHILTILLIWTMLVAYHRLYDTLVVVFFMVLFSKSSTDPKIWDLSNRQRRMLAVMMAILTLILILPARIVDKLLPEYYGRNSDAATTATLLLLLVISIFLFHRSLQNIQKLSFSRTTDPHAIRTDPHRDTQPRWANYPQSSSGTKRT